MQFPLIISTLATLFYTCKTQWPGEYSEYGGFSGGDLFVANQAVRGGNFFTNDECYIILYRNHNGVSLSFLTKLEVYDSKPRLSAFWNNKVKSLKVVGRDPSVCCWSVHTSSSYRGRNNVYYPGQVYSGSALGIGIYKKISSVKRLFEC